MCFDGSGKVDLELADTSTVAKYRSTISAKLMGHAKEIITIDVYGDNENLIPEEIPELEEYMEVMPKEEEVMEVPIDLDDFMDQE